jgi:uncharacterized protein YndB with AHSA1/START domain
MAESILITTPECEIVSSRVFGYPRERVFRAWSDPLYLRQWWGPAGFTNTFNEFDFRVGGKWSFVMHGPDKGIYVNECEFIKVDPPSLIAWKRFSKPHFQVVATFDELSPVETRLVFRMLFNTADECGKVRPFAVGKNEENFDRLDKVLAEMSVHSL